MKAGATVEVVGMAPEDECEQEMFVEIVWDGDTLAVPLIQLEAPEADVKTQQAILYLFQRRWLRERDGKAERRLALLSESGL